MSLRLTRRHFVRLGAASALSANLLRDGVPRAFAQKETQVGYVFIGPVSDGGWTEAHDVGRRYVDDNLPNVSTLFQESVSENPADAERVIADFVNKGARIVFTTSFGYMEATINAANRFPDATFIHISGYKTAKNAGTLFGWQDEPRYVCGQIAGKMSPGGTIGMVAAFPIAEVVRAINAFTLGARKSNPEARVKVLWTGTWFDPPKERAAADALIDAGVDLMAQYQDSPAAAQAAEAAGFYAVGNDMDMSDVVSNHLVAPVWNWGPTEARIVQGVIDGTYTPGPEIGDWKSGLVGLSPLHPDVPQEVRDLAAAETASFTGGQQSEFTVFSGPINDQDGNERVAPGQSLTVEELLGMDFFVEGVEGDPTP